MTESYSIYSSNQKALEMALQKQADAMNAQWAAINKAEEAAKNAVDKAVNQVANPTLDKSFWSGSAFSSTWSTSSVDKGTIDTLTGGLIPVGVNFSQMSKDLPGMNMAVKHPTLDQDDCYPECKEAGKFSTLKHHIIHLNDNHHWTREAIADWIETLDNVPTFGE